MWQTEALKKPCVALATSWVFPHVGGVSSHMTLLANQLGIKLPQVISSAHIDAYSSTASTRLQSALKRNLRKLLGAETISLRASQLIPIFDSVECDIVHCHDVMATWAAIRAKEAGRKKYKIVSTLHGPVSNVMVEEGFSPDAPDVVKVRRCEQECWPKCDALIAVDTMQADIAVGQGADRSRIGIIPNAVDLEQIDALSRSLPLEKGAGERWIMVPRRMAPKNGVEFAIRALTHLRNKPRLLIAGTGPQREYLEQLVGDLNLKEHVVFLGGLGHSLLIPLMAASDLVVVPSIPIHGIEEATSLSAIEAMALKKPVIASNIGGLKELITSGTDGLLVPPKELVALAEAFAAVLDDPALSRKLGEEARKTVDKKFSVALWFDRHLSVYEKALAGS